jgi:hypothetical protein
MMMGNNKTFFVLLLISPVTTSMIESSVGSSLTSFVVPLCSEIVQSRRSRVDLSPIATAAWPGGQPLNPILKAR